MKTIFLLAVGIFFAGNFFAEIVHAEIKTVTGTGEYIMSKKETPEFAEKNAKLYAERDALEQAGIFISSSSIVERTKLKKDEISTFAVGLLKNISVQKSEMIPLTNDAQGYIKIFVIVEAKIDSDDFEIAMKKWLSRDEQERINLIEQNKEQQKIISELKNKIAELEKVAKNLKTDADKENFQQKLSEIDKKTLATEKFEEGNKIFDQKNYQAAILKYTEAIELNQNYASAYNNRGLAYAKLKNYSQAISDYDNAIKNNPQHFFAYSNRGLANYYLKNYQQAIEDCTKSIQINRNYSGSYNNRGMAYDEIENYVAAVVDYQKAIELEPTFAKAYNNLGWTLANLKNYSQAIDSYNKAIELDPNYALAYRNRARCYKAIGETEKAEADLQRAKELN